MSTQLYNDDYAELLDCEDDTADGFLAELSTIELAYIEEKRTEAIAHDLLRMAKTVKTLQTEIDTLIAHQEDTARRINARRKRLDGLKAWMQDVFTQAGLTEKVKDELVTVYVQKSPASCEVVDEASVPGAYKRVTVALPWAQALELLPEEVLANASVQVLRIAILQEAKETGAVPEGVVIHNDNRHLVVR